MSARSDRFVPVPSLVLRHADSRPDHVALVYPHGGRGYRTIGYGDLARRVGAIAGGLRRSGIARRDRVVVLVPMSLELYLVLLAVSSIGAVAVFVEPASEPREIASAIRVTRPRAFVGVAKAHVLRLVSREVARVPIKIVVGSGLAARALFARSLADIEHAGAGRGIPPIDADPGDPALLTFSSGSTGAPKGAVRSHEFLTEQHGAIQRLLARHAGQDDVHMSAFAIVLLSTLASGMTAVIPRLGRGGVSDVDADELLVLIRDRRVSVVSGSPTFLAPILETARARGYRLDSIRRIVSGGAPVPIPLCDIADEDLLPNGSFRVVYGSTEAEPIATIDAPEIRRETAELTRKGAGLCVGTPDPKLRLRLLAPTRGPIDIGPAGIDGLTVAAGEVGEVSVSGPHVNRGYYRNRTAERQTKIIDETGALWHRTGDAGYLDRGGRLWIVGRVADTVRCGDLRYHPAAVEAAAQSLSFVDRAALIEYGDGGARLLVKARRASAATAVAGLVRGRDGKAAAVQRHLAASGVAVERVDFVRDLPVDPRHRAKLDYPAIRRDYA